MGVERELQVIQVTSPSPGEGKSTTIANLAVALARAGQRVVVVCCDLRRPRIHQFFGVGNEIGLTSALLGERSTVEAVQAVPGLVNVVVLASGPVPPNPSELLAGGRLASILDGLRASADVVLVDCPPILPVTDAAVLANRVDGTLLVVAAGHTHQKELQRAVELLRQVDAPLLGCVLNGVSESAGYGYSYRYRSTYDSAPPAPATSAVPAEERLRA
jgi:non-specific protein-tyrosine kinase